MQMDLNNVITQIKKEGVEKAEEEAANIIKDAEAKAEGIVRSAEQQKEDIISQGETEADQFRASGEESLRQAARNIVVALRTQLTALLDSIVKREIQEQFTPEVLKEILVNLITHCKAQEDFNLEILLNEADKERLRKFFGSTLQQAIRKGVTFKASPSIKKGFRVGEKGKNLYYDFSDEAIAEAFDLYLNRKLKLILDAGLQDVQ